MEVGSFANDQNGTFTLTSEDHTMGNAVRFMLNQDPRVKSTGYSIPHPSHECVNIQVQTTGDPAREVFRDACQELMLMNRHVRSVFDKAVAEFKVEKAREEAEEEARKKVAEETEALLNKMDIESN